MTEDSTDPSFKRLIDRVTADRQRIWKSVDPTTRGWGIVLAGSVARLALGLVASVLIARQLGPNAFGTYALLGVIGSVAGMLADPGLTGSAVKRVASTWPIDPIQARRRAQRSVLIRLGVATIVTTALAVVVAPISTRFFGPAVIGGLVVLALAGVVATGVCGALTAIIQATRRFGRLSLLLLVNPGLTAVLASVLALTGRLTLVSALVVLGIAPALVASAAAYGLLPFRFKSDAFTLAGLRDEGIALLAFGRWLWLSDLLASLAGQLDLLLLDWLGAAPALGLYALAANLAGKADVVNHSLYAVLVPTASALRGSNAVRVYVRRALVRSAGIAACLAVLFPLSGPLIQLLYGPAYAVSASLFRGLLGVALVDVFALPLTLLAYHFDRPRLLASADALRLVVLVVGAVALVPNAGVSGVIWAKLLSRVAGALLVLVALGIAHIVHDGPSPDRS